RMRSGPDDGFAAKIIGRPQRLGLQSATLLLPRGALWLGKELRRSLRDRTRLAQVPPVIPEIVDAVDGGLPAEFISDCRLQPGSAQHQQDGFKFGRLGIFLAKPALEWSGEMRT